MPVQPSADFTALLAGARPELQPLRTRLDPVLEYLANHGVDTDSLALVELFTTQAIADDLLAIRDRLDSGAIVSGAAAVFDNSPIPGLTTGIFAEGTTPFQEPGQASTSPNIAAVAIGTFDSYDFRSGPDGPFDPDADQRCLGARVQSSRLLHDDPQGTRHRPAATRSSFSATACTAPGPTW